MRTVPYERVTIRRENLMYELAKQQMTSKELEERTKLSESTIYNAKLGRMIKLETAQRIADALNVSLNFLLTPMVEVA